MGGGFGGDRVEGVGQHDLGGLEAACLGDAHFMKLDCADTGGGSGPPVVLPCADPEVLGECVAGACVPGPGGLCAEGPLACGEDAVREGDGPEMFGTCP